LPYVMNEGEILMNLRKKVIYIKGFVKLPLKIGMTAIIFYDGGIIKTPPVEMIKRIAEDIIVFKTRNSTYCVVPYFSPESAAMTVNAYRLYACA